MFSHVMVGSNDIERSKRFYDAVLGVLGAGEAMENRNAAGQMRLFYRHGGSSFCVTEPIDGEPATFANGGTIGFKCESPEQVTQFHDVAVGLKLRKRTLENRPGAFVAELRNEIDRHVVGRSKARAQGITAP